MTQLKCVSYFMRKPVFWVFCSGKIQTGLLVHKHSYILEIAEIKTRGIALLKAANNKDIDQSTNEQIDLHLVDASFLMTRPMVYWL